MGAAWVAGTVRARALLSRRVGAAAARRLAGLGSVDAVIRELGDGPYGRELRPGLTTAQVEAVIGATLLWQMRVLAGWLAGPGVRTVRLLAAWFEIVNTVDHARSLAGAQALRRRRRPLPAGRARHGVAAARGHDLALRSAGRARPHAVG